MTKRASPSPTKKARALPRKSVTRPREPAPAERPLRAAPRADVLARFEAALGAADGVAAAHCVHELWMRGEIGLNVEPMLERLWQRAAATVPEWLPMRYVEWLPRVYDVTARFERGRRGRHNVYLVLLDYSDSRPEPHGIYVGMTHYAPAQRFDQHKAGIRAAGSVLRRGLEVLTGPTLHLQRLTRADATRIEEQLAEVLRAEGLFVQGGH
jgi:hypothetical protein